MSQRGFWIGLILLLALGSGGLFFSASPEAEDFLGGSKRIVLVDDGLWTEYEGIRERTVREFLEHHAVQVRAEDIVYPELENPLFSGTRIQVFRAQAVTVKVDQQEKSFFTQARSVEEAIRDAGIALDADDIVKPDRDLMIRPQMRISITRVEVREETKQSDIPFATKVREDEKLSWRKKVTTQKGEKGVKTTTYRVAYHDGKEINRRVLKTDITQEPIPEEVTQGTLVQVGKSHRGAASWYAFTGTMAAANPWLPKGSYVRVTNVDNGKSVIVVINDRGPFVPGRIIDLDKVAFQKIASLGAGVINVKMEEITN